MACNTCFTSCLIHPCYDNIWIGKATANNNYLVKVTNIGSGRVIAEQVTATSAGLVKLSGGTWNDFFNSGSQFEFKLYQMDFSQSPNVKASKNCCNIIYSLHPDGVYNEGMKNTINELRFTEVEKKGKT